MVGFRGDHGQFADLGNPDWTHAVGVRNGEVQSKLRDDIELATATLLGHPKRIGEFTATALRKRLRRLRQNPQYAEDELGLPLALNRSPLAHCDQALVSALLKGAMTPVEGKPPESGKLDGTLWETFDRTLLQMRSDEASWKEVCRWASAAEVLPSDVLTARPRERRKRGVQGHIDPWMEAVFDAQLACAQEWPQLVKPPSIMRDRWTNEISGQTLDLIAALRDRIRPFSKKLAAQITDASADRAFHRWAKRKLTRATPDAS